MTTDHHDMERPMNVFAAHLEELAHATERLTEAGVKPLALTCTRTDTAARVQVFWEDWHRAIELLGCTGDRVTSMTHGAFHVVSTGGPVELCCCVQPRDTDDETLAGLLQRLERAA